jgi:hypothetical protein
MDVTALLSDMLETNSSKPTPEFKKIMSMLEKKIGPVTVEYTENGQDLLYVSKEKKYFRETPSDPLELSIRKAVNDLESDADPALIVSDPWKVMLSKLDKTGDGVYTGDFSSVETPMKRIAPPNSVAEMRKLFRLRVLNAANDKLVELRKALSAVATGASPKMRPVFNDLSKKPVRPSENVKGFEKEMADYNQKTAVWNANNAIMKMAKSLGILYSDMNEFKKAMEKYRSGGKTASSTEDTRNLLSNFQYTAGDQKEELAAGLPKLEIHETGKYTDRFFDMSVGWKSWRDPPITLTAFHQ